MIRRVLAVCAVVCAVFTTQACGPTDPGCKKACEEKWSCPPGEPNYNCIAALDDCIEDC